MFYEVIIDRGETANKCTIAPVSQRPDFRIFRVQETLALGPLSAPILLHHQGECITELKKSLGEVQGIASIDCVWHRLDGLINRIAGVKPAFARIPDGFETVYPRHNRHGKDPSKGLATIEAIFIGAALIGRWDVSLLSKYYFAEKFLQVNQTRFLELGVRQASEPYTPPEVSPWPRNALQRRRDRGRRVHS